VAVQVLLKTSLSSTRGRSRTSRRGFKTTTQTTTLDNNVLGGLSGIHPEYPARKEEDGFLLEFPCNPTRTLREILLGLLPCNRLGTLPLDYIKEGRVPRRASEQPNTKHRAPHMIPQTGRRVHHLGGPNLYKSCVSCTCAYLRVPGLTIPSDDPHHNHLPRVLPW
jgi:hypothetical protein